MLGCSSLHLRNKQPQAILQRGYAQRQLNAPQDQQMPRISRIGRNLGKRCALGARPQHQRQSQQRQGLQLQKALDNVQLKQPAEQAEPKYILHRARALPQNRQKATITAATAPRFLRAAYSSMASRTPRQP